MKLVRIEEFESILSIWKFFPPLFDCYRSQAEVIGSDPIGYRSKIQENIGSREKIDRPEPNLDSSSRRIASRRLKSPNFYRCHAIFTSNSNLYRDKIPP